MPRTSRVFSCALSLCLLAAASARAERVAALPPRVTGAARVTLQDGFRASLAGGLASAGHDAAAALDVDRALAQHPALAACTTDVCLAQLGGLLSARAILRSAIEVIGSSNYSFRIDLYDVRAEHVTASIDDTCTVCTVREANEALSRASSTLGLRLASGAAAVVASAPATLPGHRGTATPRSRLYLGLGGAAIALGLGAVGGGAALLAIDGRETAPPTLGQDGLLRKNVLTTFVPGIILTSAGALLLAGSGVLFWRSHANRRR